MESKHIIADQNEGLPVYLNVDAKHIRRFLDNCDGNWHNCIHVACPSCRPPKTVMSQAFSFTLMGTLLRCSFLSPLQNRCFPAVLNRMNAFYLLQCLNSFPCTGTISKRSPGRKVHSHAPAWQCSRARRRRTTTGKAAFPTFLRTAYIKEAYKMLILILQWLDEIFTTLIFIPMTFVLYCRFTMLHKKNCRTASLYQLCLSLSILFVVRYFCGRFIFTDINYHRFTDNGLFPLVRIIFYPESR